MAEPQSGLNETGTIPTKIESERVPVFPWLSGYRSSWLGRDVAAGVSTAAIVIPQAMAYATIAGLPVQYGLYVATVPMLVYAVLGTSRPLSVSTTSTVAALTATAIAGADASPATAAATLAVMVGLILVLSGVLRLGFVADFISAPVLAGFKIGTALVIMAGQLGKVLGVDIAGDNFFAQIWSALRRLGEVHWPTLLLASSTIVVLLLLRRFAPRLPGALVVFVCGIAAVVVFDLSAEGVSLVPGVPSGLPIPTLPDLSLAESLLPGALGIALMTFVESIASARAFQKGEEVPLSADRELLALGAASASGGFFRSMPAAGGLSQTAVNDTNGARSPLAGAVTGVFAMVTLLFLTPLFEDLAQATLGAIVLVAILGLLDTKALRAIQRINRRDYLLAAAAVVGILFLGVLGGVLVAIVLSILALLRGVNLMPIRIMGVDQHGHLVEIDKGGQPLPEVLVVRPEGGIYFANVGRVRSRLESALASRPDVRTMIMDASSIPDIETTGAMGLEVLERRLAERQIDLWVVAPTPRVSSMLASTFPESTLERIVPSIDKALPDIHG